MALKTQQSHIVTLDDSVSPNVWKELEEVNNITGPDGKAKLIDVTHLRSTGKEYLQGIPDFGQVSLDCNFTGGYVQTLLRTRYATQAVKKKFRIHVPDDVTAYFHTWEFTAIVTSWNLDIKVDDKTGLKIMIQVVGGVTYYPPSSSPSEP